MQSLPPADALCQQGLARRPKSKQAGSKQLDVEVRQEASTIEDIESEWQYGTIVPKWSQLWTLPFA